MKRRTASSSDPRGHFVQILKSAHAALGVCLTLPLLAALANAQSTFLTFDTLQGRPIAISPDKTKLFAINTPDNHLEIFDIDLNGDLVPAGSVPGRHGAHGRCGAQRRRGLGGEFPLRQRERRRCLGQSSRGSSARCSLATSRATSSSPGRVTTAHSSPQRTAAKTAPTPMASTTYGGHRARGHLGLQCRESGHLPWAATRSRPSRSSATSRVRSRVRQTVRRSTRRSSTQGNQTMTLNCGLRLPDRLDGSEQQHGRALLHASMAERPRAACRPRTRTRTSGRHRPPGERDHRLVEARRSHQRLAGRARSQLEQLGEVRVCLIATSSRSTPTRIRRWPSTAALDVQRWLGVLGRASVRRSSTWR